MKVLLSIIVLACSLWSQDKLWSASWEDIYQTVTTQDGTSYKFSITGDNSVNIEFGRQFGENEIISPEDSHLGVNDIEPGIDDSPVAGTTYDVEDNNQNLLDYIDRILANDGYSQNFLDTRAYYPVIDSYKDCNPDPGFCVLSCRKGWRLRIDTQCEPEWADRSYILWPKEFQ